MDIYILSLLTGGGGLIAMSLGSFGRHGHAGSGHAGGAHAHGGGHGHGAAPGAAHGGTAQHGGHHAGDFAARGSWLLSAPRVLFSVLLGLGATGEVLSGMLGPLPLFVAALAGGVLFERFVITPIWNFSLRFASNPARTLESAVTDEATAVTSFDANGEGIVSIEVDGQIIQLLARLKPDDRLIGGRVRAGQKLRIDEVNTSKNRCTVSLL